MSREKTNNVRQRFFGTQSKKNTSSHKTENLLKQHSIAELVSSWLKWKYYYHLQAETKIDFNSHYNMSIPLQRTNEARAQLEAKKIKTRDIPTLAVGYLIQQWHESNEQDNSWNEILLSKVKFMLDSYPNNNDMTEVLKDETHLLTKLAKLDVKTFDARFAIEKDFKENADKNVSEPNNKPITIGRNRGRSN